MPSPSSRILPSPSNPLPLGWLRTLALIGFGVLAMDGAWAADALITVPSNATAAQLGQQELAHLLRTKLPGQPQATIERAAHDFLQHLSETSPIIAENFSAGRLSADELASRLDIFLGSHPEYTGKATTLNLGDARQRISSLLKAAPDIARTDADRQRLTEQFLQQLGALSGTAKEELLGGRMSQDDLQTRVSVFISDTRANASKVAADPAEVAAVPIVESYIKANFGTASERMDSICYRGTVDDNKTKHEFVAFKMRPNLFRLHILKDGLVYAVLAYDGTQAWEQSMGRPPVSVVGSQAEEIAISAQFDDLLLGYRERGASVRLLDRQGSGPYQLRIHESDGTEEISVIDPVNFTQVALRRKRPDGHVRETRFDDYRTVGTAKIAFRSQDLNDGVVHATTTYSNVVVDSGVIPRFFSRPEVVSFGFMDMMGGLALIESQAKNASTAAKAKSTP